MLHSLIRFTNIAKGIRIVCRTSFLTYKQILRTSRLETEPVIQPKYSGIIPGMSGNWPELAVPSRSGDVGNAAEVAVHG